MTVKECEKTIKRAQYSDIESFDKLRHAEGFMEAVEKFRPLMEAAQHCVEYFGEAQPTRRLRGELESYRRTVLGEE